MGKLFVRERQLVGPGAGLPRFVLVAALGTDLRVYAKHFRKAELEKLAEEAGAEIVYLPLGEHAGEPNEAEQRGGPGMGRGRGQGPGHRRGGRSPMDQE